MLACGSMDFLNPFPALPPAPEANVDRSSFDELPIEDRLAITQRNLRQLQETLRLKESDFEDLQHEMKFHAIKNEELMDVVNAFRSSSADRSHNIMKAKAEQNSELTLQVHALRDLLTKSGEEVAALQSQLQKKTAQFERLSATKESHQRLKAQLDDLAKSLDNVYVNAYGTTAPGRDEWSEWLNIKWKLPMATSGDDNNDNDGAQHPKDEHSKLIQRITRKMANMEADRQRLLKESKLYSESDGQKEDTIRSLQQILRKMQHEHDELKETNRSLEQQMTVREGKIGALEELFQTINSNRTLGAKKNKTTYPGIERSVSLMNLEDDDEDDDNDDNDDEDYEDVDIDGSDKSVAQTFEEIFVGIWSNFTGTTADATEEKTEVSSCLSDSDYDTKQVQEELQAAAKQEFEELQEFHKLLSEDYETVQFQLSNLKARLGESNTKANSYKKKAEMRESLLKDVIHQYKELQLEHSGSLDRIQELKQQVAAMLEAEQQEQQRRQEQQDLAAAAAAAANYTTKNVVVVQEAPTFELSERTERTSQENEHENENENENENETEHEHEDSDEEDPSSLPFGGLDPNFVMEDYKRLETECDRLQHEFDTAIDKITSLEEAIETAQTETRDSERLQTETIAALQEEKLALQEKVTALEAALEDAKSKITESERLRTEQAQKIEFMEVEKIALQERVIEATAKIVDKSNNHSQRKWEIEDELRLAQLREQQARQKQMEREKDLWAVIEQYKALAEQNDSSTAEKTDEFAELTKTLEEALEKSQRLAADLELAKSEVVQSEEETKEIRKRLLDCHFHQKQVQELRDAQAKQKILEREQELWKIIEQSTDANMLDSC